MVDLCLTHSLLLTITKENRGCVERIRNHTDGRQSKGHQFAQRYAAAIDRGLDRRNARLWRGNARPNIHSLWRLSDGRVFLLRPGN